MKITVEQMFFTTADIERRYFSGEVSEQYLPDPPSLPAGVYRVVGGVLYQIVPGKYATEELEKP